MDFVKGIQHVIWDWNGTLVDDTEFCVQLINSVLSRRKLPGINIETYRETFGFPVIDYYRRIGFDLERHDFKILSDEFISGYISKRRELTLQKGAIPALQFFKARGIPQCMLSASQTSALKESLQEHSIDHYFKTVLGLDHHYADGKTHLGKTWLNHHNVDRNRVLFIGDTLHDLEVANAMGTQCLLIANGHHSKKRLSDNHHHVLNNLEQFNDLFEER